jgi:hypothetical protein
MGIMNRLFRLQIDFSAFENYKFSPNFCTTRFDSFLIDEATDVGGSVRNSSFSDKMEHSSLKNKGNVPILEKRKLIEELKKASPRKKSKSAKLNLVFDKKEFHLPHSSTTIGSEIKFMLRQMVERKEEMRRIQERKMSQLDKGVAMPRILDNSVDSYDSNDNGNVLVTMRDIPIPSDQQ